MIVDATELLTLSAATRELPGRVHSSTVWRWCRIGVRARNGERVLLEHRRMGRRIYTTRAALDAFGRALAEADTKAFDASHVRETTTTKPRGTTSRERAISQAEDVLHKAGI